MAGRVEGRGEDALDEPSLAAAGASRSSASARLPEAPAENSLSGRR